METLQELVVSFIKEHLLIHILLITLSVLLLMVSMLVDYKSGLRKAKELGIAKDSTKMKKTCDKARKYFSPYIALVCIDLLGCIIVPIPVFSMLWAAWCIYCEFSSVKEKAWKKAELRKAERTMNVVLENRDDLAKAIVSVLTDIGNKDEKD